jgi:hypothetical protein
MNEELIQILKDYVATANNPKYEGDWNVIDSKFPELSNYDKQLLKDYVATANNPSYGGDWSVVNSKFPELFEEVKKKETSEVSSQEEPLASPMETPTLASLPGRDATLPPSPTLAPQLAQTLERIAPMDKVEAEVAMTTGAAFEQPAPTQEQFPVPYETRPTEVTTEDGLTLDLETAGISGETGVAPEAMDVMQERIATGAVAMPEAQPIPEGEPSSDYKSFLGGETEWGFGDAMKYLANKGISGLESVLSLIREEGGERKVYILDYIENNKETEPELYSAYLKFAEELKADHPKNYALLAAEKAYRNVAGFNILPFVKTAKDQELNTKIESSIRNRYKQDRLNTYGFDVDKAVERAIEENAWMQGVGGLVESIPAMVTNGVTGGLSFFNMSYQGAEDELAQQLAQNPEMKVSKSQMNSFLLGRAAVEGILERVGLGNVLKGTPLLKKLITNKVLSKVIGAGGEAGSEMFEKAVKQEIKGLERYIRAVAGGALSEAETGALQQLSNEAFNSFIRDSEGKRVFEEKAWADIANDVIYAGFLEAIGGGLMGGTIGAIQNPNAMTTKEFEQAENFVKDVNINKVTRYLDEQVTAGKTTDGQKQVYIDNINEFKNTVDKTPDNVSVDDRKKIFRLIGEKQRVLDEVQGKDEAIQATAKERVAEIDNQIKEIYNSAKKKGATEKKGAPEAVTPESLMDTGGEKPDAVVTPKEKEDAVQEQTAGEVPFSQKPQLAKKWQEIEARRSKSGCSRKGGNRREGIK